MEASHCKHAQVVELLRIVVIEGDGIETPLREVTQYWSKNGEFLFENA